MMAGIRRAVAYTATGVFFVVAAISLVQGAQMWDAMAKATVSCIIVYAMGRALIGVLDEAAWRVDSGKPAPRRTPRSVGGGVSRSGEVATGIEMQDEVR